MQGQLNKELTLIFTYGTLKKGYYNSYHLTNSEYMGEGVLKKPELSEDQTINEYYQIVLDNKWFVPYLFPIEKIQRKHPELTIQNAKEIVGEIYLVDNNTLKILDQLESVPIRYRRDVKLIKAEDRQNQDLLKKLDKYNIQYTVEQDNQDNKIILFNAGVYICNLDLDEKFQGFSEIFNNYTLELHKKYVIPSKREHISFN